MSQIISMDLFQKSKFNEHSKFLAINTQLNAYNYSYHTIKNYKKFNTLIINENELRNETRDKSSKIENLMMNLSKTEILKIW